MTHIPLAPSAQRRSRLVTCRHCGDPIPTGSHRPRIFCDRPGCRKASSRHQQTPPGEFCDDPRLGYQAPKGVLKAITAIRLREPAE